MKEIKKIIEFLYPETASNLIFDIDSMVSHYKTQVISNNFNLNEKDVVLITYADSFKDEDETNFQTLKKVGDRYLKGIVNSVHILPFYPFTSDDGFSVVDYKKVNSDYGNWNDVEALGKSFYLMFDAVINHISKSSDWFQGFLNENPEYENFFVEGNPKDEALQKVVRPRALPLLHSYNKKGKEVFVWTTFSEDQVDLNYKNPKVFLKVLDVLLFYISKGAKLIRLDAIAFMWKTIGTNCIHLEQTHQIIKAYRKIIELVAPQTVIITETNVPHTENISYFGDGSDEAHMVYNFTLPPLIAHSLHQQNIDILNQWANSLELPSNNTCFFNFTASHDGIGVRPLQGIIANNEINKLAKIAENHGGFVSYKDNGDGTKAPYELNCNYMDLLTSPELPDEKRIQRFLLSQSVMLTMPGVPGIYYHSLFGSENYVKGVLDSGINRRINREKLSFPILNEALKDKGSLRSKVYEQYKEMLKVRVSEEAFDPFETAKFYNDNNVFVIERTCKNSSIYCVHNFTNEEKNITQIAQNTTDLISGEINITLLKPFEFRWLKNN
jgi:sucrose phosphorylase